MVVFYGDNTKINELARYIRSVFYQQQYFNSNISEAQIIRLPYS